MLFRSYKLGWKTSYYQNTYDYKVDPSEIIEEEPKLEETIIISSNQPEEDEMCEACAI